LAPGVGAASVTGPAACSSNSASSCGQYGIGALSVTGNASCTGNCGSLGRSSLTQGGLGAVSVLGHAQCTNPFVTRNPGAGVNAECVGGADVLNQLGVPTSPAPCPSASSTRLIVSLPCVASPASGGESNLATAPTDLLGGPIS
jgi:hypothetical protein